MPDSPLVRDVMTTQVTTVDPNDKLSAADDIMKLGRMRHMPVVDDEGLLVGIVTQRDLFHNALLKALGYGTHAADRALDMYFVKEAMTTEVVTVLPDTPLTDAAALMVTRKIGCVVVMDGDRVAGILTEGDFVRRAAEGQ